MTARADRCVDAARSQRRVGAGAGDATDDRTGRPDRTAVRDRVVEDGAEELVVGHAVALGRLAGGELGQVELAASGRRR